MTATLEPYPDYKPSGVEWLGDVPAHWGVRRAKFFYREVDERSSTGSEELMSVSHKTGVTPRKQNVTMFLAESNVGYKVCRPGDIVINTMWAYMAALGVARQDGLVSPSYGVYRPLNQKNLHHDYIDFLLRTEAYRTAYLILSTGITASRLRLYPESFLGIPLLYCPLAEQIAIVDYLDHVDQRIHRYIDSKEKLIGLLEEQRRAVIHRAVIRGLDPNVRLKPSGVSWIGDVPVHWEMRRLKTYAENVVDQTEEYEAGEICLALEDVESWTGRYEESGSYDGLDSQAKKFRVGDVLFCKLRPYLAKVVRPSRAGICVGEFLVLRSSDSSMTPHYLEQLLRSRPVIDAINASTFGARMPRADWQFIGGMNQPVPPLSEQVAIVEYLDKATADIDTAIDRTHREIELVREYRERLIADVVTGKLDVREAAGQLPEPGEKADEPPPSGETEVHTEDGRRVSEHVVPSSEVTGA